MSIAEATIPTLRKILLIDDDPDDCYLFTDAIKSQFPSIELNFVNNVLQTFDYLKAKAPDLIFLDLNMPFKKRMKHSSLSRWLFFQVLITTKT